MASKRISKKSISKIPPKTAERIVAISLQHPELGARRLVPLLKKKRISASATTIQSILRRHGLQTRAKRLAKIKKQARRPKALLKKPSTKVTDDVADRICEISLQNPELGGKRLIPLLQKQGILLSSSAVYRILKRRGMQTRTKRLAKIQETPAEPLPIPKRFPEKIPPEVEERVIKLSSQHPDYGARRLVPLLQQEEIFVSASTVYTILKHNNLETLKKRLLKLEAQQALEVPLSPILEMPTEAPEQVPEPAVVIPTPPLVEEPLPVEPPEPVPGPDLKPPISAEAPPVKRVPLKTVKKRGHWVFYPLYLLLFVLIGYLGFHAVQTLQYVRLETGKVTVAESATVGIAARAESSASVQPLGGYSQIWERNLFNITKPKEPDSEKKISLDKIAPAKKDLGLELVGTVVADDPMMSLAIIDNRGIRKQEAYREGDKAGEVRIKKILRNNVVITTAKGDELLTVEIKDSGKRSTPYPTAEQVGSQSSSAQQAPGSRRPRARTRSIKLKREEVEASLSDIGALIEQVQLTPYMQGDQPSGFRISNIPADSILRKMGLRSRDVIVGVDDENIAGPDQASDFFQKLAAGDEVTIRVKRRRRTRQIKLSFE